MIYHHKIWLDDERPAPDTTWLRLRLASEVIQYLRYGDVGEVSLDHDLGQPRQTGYDVLLWIEEHVITTNFTPPIIHIHTANSSARIKMEMARDMIECQVIKRHQHVLEQQAAECIAEQANL